MIWNENNAEEARTLLSKEYNIIFFHQTKHQPGNCLEACLATIFQVSISETPILMGNPNWKIKLDLWLNNLLIPHQMFSMSITEQNKDLTPPTLNMINGYALDGSPHSVVGLGNNILFDPNPNNPHPHLAGKIQGWEFIFFVPLFPQGLLEEDKQLIQKINEFKDYKRHETS